MRKIIFAVLTAIILASTISVFAEGFVPEGWSDKDVANFNRHYGSDIGKFFGVSDTAGYTKEQVIEYFNSRPGIIAPGYAVDENGMLVEESSIKKDEPTIPEPGDDAKEAFKYTETDKVEKSEEKPFPIVLAVLLTAVLAASVAVLVTTRKKGR